MSRITVISSLGFSRVRNMRVHALNMAYGVSFPSSDLWSHDGIKNSLSVRLGLLLCRFCHDAQKPLPKHQTYTYIYYIKWT